MRATAPWEGFAWVRPPVEWQIDTDGDLHWLTRPASDFWRHTGGVVGADDGDAFLLPVAGDFSVTMRLTSRLDAAYDQCGLMVRVDERTWLKAGIELDGGTWFSVVATRETSDWSKQATSDGNAAFTVWRAGDTLRVGLEHEGSVHLVRELVFDGPVSVGPYSCAPQGDGFPVAVTATGGPAGEWVLTARAGRL